MIQIQNLLRMRRKRLKSGNGSGSGSSDEHRRLSKMRSRSAGNPRSSSSDLTTSGTSTAYSSSDMSCDTVVYRGQSDGSGTDGEGVPVLLPALRCLMQSGSSGGSAGSAEELGRPQPRRRNSGSRILTNGAISPRRTLSPTQMSPNRSLNRYLLQVPTSFRRC